MTTSWVPSVSQSMLGIGSGILILGMWTLFGVLIGAIARGPALAVGLGLVWVLVVENPLRGVASLLGPVAAVTDYLPGTAAGTLRTVKGDPVPGVLDILTRSQSMIVLALYLSAFALATVVLIRRRDLA